MFVVARAFALAQTRPVHACCSAMSAADEPNTLGLVSLGRAVAVLEDLQFEARADPDLTEEERSILTRLQEAASAAQQEIGGGATRRSGVEAASAAANLDEDQLDSMAQLVARLRKRRGQRRLDAIKSLHGAVLAVAGLEPDYSDGPKQIGLRSTRFLGRGHVVLREAALVFSPPLAHVRASAGQGGPSTPPDGVCSWCLGRTAHDEAGPCPEVLSGRSCRKELPAFSPELRPALKTLLDEERGGNSLLPVMVWRLAAMLRGLTDKPLGQLEPAPTGQQDDHGGGGSDGDASQLPAPGSDTSLADGSEHGLEASEWASLHTLRPLGAALGLDDSASTPSALARAEQTADGGATLSRMTLRASLACLQALPADAWPAEARPFLRKEAELVAEALEQAGAGGVTRPGWTETDHLAVAGVAKLSAFDFATPLDRPGVAIPDVFAALDPTSGAQDGGTGEAGNTDAESLTATSERLGRALFPATVSLLNHSCAPNCALRFEAGPVAKLVSLQDILPGRELTISYIDAQRMSKQQRYRRLQLHHAFSCACEGECPLPETATEAGVSQVPAGTTMGLEL